MISLTRFSFRSSRSDGILWLRFLNWIIEMTSKTEATIISTIIERKIEFVVITSII
jgi:hypothetical protein